MKRGRGLFALLLLVGGIGAAASNEADLASFQMVWETINEKHWDLASTGIDWQEVYERYKPKIAEADSRTETRALLNEMLELLGQSHFQILDQGSVAELNELERKFGGGTATPGFKVGLVEDRLFIVNIDADSDAADKGLGIGTEILSLQGEKIAPVLDTVKNAFAASKHAGLQIAQTLNSFFTGTSGDRLDLKVRLGGKAKKISVALKRPKGKFVDLLNLSPIYYRYDAALLDGDIAYIAFNVFLPEVKGSFESDLKGRFRDTNGLVIDLRGNPGGLGLLSVALANRLVSERGKRLGAMTNEGGTMNFAIFPQKPIYEKPVAVLIDEGSASTSEILAAGLQDLDRARVFGTRSAGAALPSFIVDLPNGDRFQYAIGDYTSYKGRKLEAAGVVPDQLTPHTLTSMKNGEDAALKAATEWIQNTDQGARDEKL